jgi:hypothetical protein
VELYLIHHVANILREFMGVLPATSSSSTVGGCIKYLATPLLGSNDQCYDGETLEQS